MKARNKMLRTISFVGPVAMVALSLSSVGCTAVAGSADQAETLLKVAAGYLALLFLLLYGGVVLWKVIDRNEIGTIIEENGGGASMSRFQFLIFTFVVAFGIVFLLAKNNQFPTIPADVLTLLGISASTYAVSKGITASGTLPPKNGPAKPDGDHPEEPEK